MAEEHSVAKLDNSAVMIHGAERTFVTKNVTSKNITSKNEVNFRLHKKYWLNYWHNL